MILSLNLLMILFPDFTVGLVSRILSILSAATNPLWNIAKLSMVIATGDIIAKR